MSKDIFVFVEQRSGEVQKVALELLGEAGRLAKELNENVVAVILGENIKDKAFSLFEYGADKVIVADHPLLAVYMTAPYTKVLTELIRDEDPAIVLLGATSIGRDLAPRIAAHIHTGLTADCTELAIEPDSSLLQMTRPAFGGNLMATIVCNDYRPQMATVRPGVMEPIEPIRGEQGELQIKEVQLTPEDLGVEIIEIQPRERVSRDITEANILLSAGYGIGGKEGLDKLAVLADLLGAEVSASRACVDAGIIEKHQQVGQTGKTVRPNLYVACGISGAVQHVVGMEDSDFILAINKDESAPIMDMADLAIVGDLSEIIPALTQAVANRKS